MPLYPAANPSYINLKDHCKIDGVTDDSVGFTAAYTLASTLGMGLFHPGGILIKGNDTLLGTVRVVGPGSALATIKLKAGANTDLFSANTSNINLSGAFGTGPSIGVTGNAWGFSGITLDGNYTNQTGGPSWVLRYYGYGELFEDVVIKNGYSGGVQRDWYGSGINLLPGSWNDVQVVFNQGVGIQIGGPTDLKFHKVFPNNNYGNNWHVCPNATGLNSVDCHSWAPNNSAGKVTSLLLEAGSCVFTGLECEGSNTAQVVLLDDRNVINGWLFAGTASGAGIKIGQLAGETPFLGQLLQSTGVTTQRYVNSNNIDLVITDITSTNGGVWYDADGGNIIRAVTSQSTGEYSSGSPGNGIYEVLGTGLTPDGSQGKGGTFQYYSSAYQGFVAGRSSDGKIWLAIDTFDGAVTTENGALLAGYSDNFSTQKWSISGSTGDIATLGNLAVGQSSTTPNPGNAGTISTADIGVSRVTPTANETGIILQAGTVPGQKCTIINNSTSFSLTFAASGSNTAQGSSLVIAAKGKYDFTWDSVAALWY